MPWANSSKTVLRLKSHPWVRLLVSTPPLPRTWRLPVLLWTTTGNERLLLHDSLIRLPSLVDHFEFLTVSLPLNSQGLDQYLKFLQGVSLASTRHHYSTTPPAEKTHRLGLTSETGPRPMNITAPYLPSSFLVRGSGGAGQDWTGPCQIICSSLSSLHTV